MLRDLLALICWPVLSHWLPISHQVEPKGAVEIGQLEIADAWLVNMQVIRPRLEREIGLDHHPLVEAATGKVIRVLAVFYPGAKYPGGIPDGNDASSTLAEQLPELGQLVLVWVNQDHAIDGRVSQQLAHEMRASMRDSWADNNQCFVSLARIRMP